MGVVFRARDIHSRVQRLVRTRNVRVEELELVEAALDEYESGKAKLARSPAVTLL